MLLADKTAIVYGGAGAIGSAVAQAYAREGAQVHLAGRTPATLEQVADRIRRDGGLAHVTAVAATDGIDICFNATSNDDVQGTALVELASADFMRPVAKSVTAHFNVATAVARHMIERRRGVILAM